MIMKKNSYRMLAAVLTGVQIFTSGPMNVFAAGIEITEESVTEVQAEALSDDGIGGYEVPDVYEAQPETEYVYEEGANEYVSDGVEASYAQTVYQTDAIEAVYSNADFLLPDSDELLAGYLDGQISAAMKTPGAGDSIEADAAAVKRIDKLNSLSANDRALYEYLEDKIVKIASGELTDTSFNIPITLFNGGKISYTAEELGCSQIDSQALQKFNAKFKFDDATIIEMLLVDHPYELYWYGKTDGYTYQPPGYTYTSSGVSYPDDAALSFELFVSADYSQSGSTHTCKTNASKIAAVNNTVPAAQAVVANAISAGCDTDYKKLVYYRDWISDNTDYNSAASMGGYSFGDPWQLIYVFDGNDSTTVVCEGYSKAFKLLCDLSTFKSAKTGAYLVNGMMSGGTGAGAHMWNIVRMDDGKYYLADITNYDVADRDVRASLFLGTYYSFLSENGQYNYLVDNNVIMSYLYSNKMLELYSAEELTMSETAYDPSVQYDPGTDPENPNPGTEPENPDPGTNPENPDPGTNPETPEPVAPTPAWTQVTPMKNVSINMPTTTVEYKGTDVTLSDYDLSYNGSNLTEGTDYTVTYKNNTKAGTATVTFTGKEWFSGSVSKKVKITKGTFTVDSLGTEPLSYTKGGVTPAVTVRCGDVVLTAGKDYTVSYKNNKKAGPAQVNVKGKGSFAGTVPADFTIQAANVNDPSIRDNLYVNAADIVYTAKPGKYAPKVTITDKTSRKKLSAGTDYEKAISYSYEDGTAIGAKDVIPAGTVLKAVIKMADSKGYYTGTIETFYRVVTADLGKSSVKVSAVFASKLDAAPDDLTYLDDVLKVTYNKEYVTRTDKSGNANFEILNYSYDRKAGKVSFTIHGLGNYGGTKQVSFNVTKPGKNHIVVYNPNGATSGNMADKRFGTGTFPLTRNTYRKNGYTFTGWNTMPDGSGQFYADAGSYTVTAEDVNRTVILYAQWSIETYSITYSGVGDAINSNPSTYTMADVEEAELALSAPVWDDKHVFMGWFTDSKFSSKSAVTGIRRGSTGNLTFYAKWQISRVEKITKPVGDYVDVTKFASEYADNKYVGYVRARTSYNIINYTDAKPDDGQDDYASIRAAICVAAKKYEEKGGGSELEIVYVPAGVYNISLDYDRQWALRLEEGVELVMDNNAILKLDPITDSRKFDYGIISVADEHDGLISNVKVRGGQIWGQRNTHKLKADQYYAHGVRILGATNVVISDMVIKDNYGDGIYVGTKHEDPHYYGCKNVTIKNCNISDNRRNNISIVDVDGILIDNCEISNANGIAPQCGIIVEPNFEKARSKEECICKNVTVNNCTVTSISESESCRAMYTQCDGNDPTYLAVRGLKVTNCTFNGFFGIYTGENFSQSGNTFNAGTHMP